MFDGKLISASLNCKREQTELTTSPSAFVFSQKMDSSQSKRYLNNKRMLFRLLLQYAAAGYCVIITE
jgi:hypothetical protein